MSTFTATGATGGAFNCTSGSYAIGRTAITTAAPTDEASFEFTTTRRPLWIRVGSSLGGQEIVQELLYYPGYHVISFTPGVSPYYIEFQLRELGEATLSGFARIAPGIFDLTSDYAAADLPLLRMEQSLNTQWIASGLTSPRALERRGTNSWSLRKYQPADGPFEPTEDGSVTLTPDSRTGTTNITASGPVFKATDAGSLLRITQAGQYETADTNAVSEATESIRVTGQGVNRTFYYSTAGTFVGTLLLERSVGNELSWITVATITTVVTNIEVADGLDNQIVYYRLRMSAYTSGTATATLVYSGGVTDGVVRVHSVTADNAIVADVLEPLASLTATGEWARGSWSDRFGWPAAVALQDGRLRWFRAGRRWASAPDDFESFLAGANDDNAIRGSLPGPMNSPVWAKGGATTLVGTIGAVITVGSGAFDVAPTPANERAKTATRFGGASADAVVVNEEEAVAFIHRSGQKLALVVPDGAKLATVDLTRLHRDAAGGPVSGSGFVELAWQSEPEPRLWAIREDGQAAVQLLNIAERIGGISRLVPAGTSAEIESICVLPGTPEDAVYLAVKRTVNSAVVRHVEKLALERWTDKEQAVRLQGSVIYSGALATAMTGLSHLEGQSVYAWGNGRVSGPYTVTAGAITLDYEVTYAIIGLKYQGRYKGPKIGPLTVMGKIDRLGMLIYRTAMGLISWGKDFTTMNTLNDRTQGGTYDSALELMTGDVSFPMDGSWTRDGRVCLRFEGVGPATMLGIVPTQNKNDR